MTTSKGELSKGWVRGASLLGWALGAWLIFRPEPYLAAVVANLLAAVLFLALVARWPGSFRIFDLERRWSFIDYLNGLIVGPAIALTFRAVGDFNPIDEAAPFGWGAGLGVILAGACWLLDRKMEDAERFVGLLVAVCWGAAAVMAVNFAFDPTPGAVHVAEVTRKVTGGRGGTWLDLRPETGAPPVVRLREDRPTQVGDRRCVEINPGLFGWRGARFIECAEALTPTPPAPSAPSPPR